MAKRIIALGLLAGVVTASWYAMSLHATPAPPTWVTSTSTTLQYIRTLATNEVLPYSPQGNRDCSNNQKLVTRPVKKLGSLTVQTEISTAACVVHTGYGMVSVGDGLLQRSGTNVAGKIKSVSAPSANVIPIPGSYNVLRYGSSANNGGQYYFFTKDFGHTLTTAVETNGQVSHTATQPHTTPLQDRSGNLLGAHYNSLSFSANGKWMVVDIPYKAVVRVNTETFEVLPFDQSFNYNIGVAPGIQSAISSDGRYAVVASASFSRFRVYDLSTCAATPATITGPVTCQYRNLQGYMASQLAGFTGVGRIRFRTNNALHFYAGYKKDNIDKTNEYYLRMTSDSGTNFEYLALGDSFASGEGAYDYKATTDTQDNKCHLSLKSYPYLIAKQLSLNSYESVACSGAIIDDISSAEESYKGQADKIEREDRTNVHQLLESLMPGYLAQHEFVTKYSPGVITVSASGNNIGFGKKILRCLEPDTCFSSYEDRYEIVKEIEAQLSNVVNMYQQLKESSAPGAKIYVIGYPQIADPGGNCAANVQLNQQELTLSSQIISRLNTVIRVAAERAGVVYVDVETAFYGSRLCEGNTANLAVNGITLGDDKMGIIGNESYHPNQKGHQLYQQAILRETNNFALPMPTSPNDTAALPAADGLAILNAPASGRALNYVNYNTDTKDNVVYRGGIWDTTINVAEFYVSALKIVLNSEPTYLGTFSPDSDGNLNLSLTIPDTIPTGFHTLHLYGQNVAGEPVDIYKTIYVAESPEDYDGDGIANNQDPCQIIEPSGQDVDQDGTDDACDDVIGEPPLVVAPPPVELPLEVEEPGEEEPEPEVIEEPDPEPDAEESPIVSEEPLPEEKTQVTYSDPEGSFIASNLQPAATIPSDSSPASSPASATDTTPTRVANVQQSATTPQVAGAATLTPDPVPSQFSQPATQLAAVNTLDNRSSYRWYLYALLAAIAALLGIILIRNKRPA